jgi:hypothetical protein
LRCKYIKKAYAARLLGGSFSPRSYGESPRSVEMMGLIGAGNNPMVGMTVAVAVAIEEASK